MAIIMLKFGSVKRLISYLKESRNELAHVIWPKREAVIKLTLIVFLITGVIALYVGALDYGFVRLLSLIIVR